jgi:hypothetical protein
MKKYIMVALTLTLSILSQSCGDKNDDVDNPVEALQTESKYPELMGNWTSQECLKS